MSESINIENEREILFDDFLRVDTVVDAQAFPEARKPAYKLWVDFGEEIGTLQTSAQITKHYAVETLKGRQVVGVVNLGKKKIAGFTSEFLVLGLADSNGDIRLIQPEASIHNGARLH